jgi:hypothetical protein
LQLRGSSATLDVGMRFPVVRGLIERRILVNYRVDPKVLAPLVPAPFRPKLHRGHGMVGICLIRLRAVRPAFVPSWLGISSENAAHRVAVEWDEGEATREGVYIGRRDTSSRLSTLAGGRLFPGIHHHARFAVDETDSHFEVALRSDDGTVSASVVADVADALPQSSVFASVGEASTFYEAGAVGYSATPDPRSFHGLELRCRGWRVEPLAVRSVRSCVYDDRAVFPDGSIAFDCALLMRGIAHEWHGKADLCCPASASIDAAPVAARRSA